MKKQTINYLRSGVALVLAAVLALTLGACGKQKQSDDALQARFAALYETDALAEMLADPAQYEAEIAGYGLDDFTKVFADADAFRSYTVEISVQNTNDFAVQVLNLQMETKKQGAKGVWFSTLTQAMPMGLPAQYTGDEAMYFYAIADAAMSKEDVLQRLGDMGVSCVYVKGNEAPDADAKLDPANLYTSAVLYAQ